MYILEMEEEELDGAVRYNHDMYKLQDRLRRLQN